MNLRQQWRQTHVGNIVPLCTSFHDDYSLNLEMFRRHVRFVIDHGINKSCGMILVSGAAGEHPALSFDERQALLETAVEAANDEVLILFGATGTSTREAVRLAQMAEKVGAGGIQMSMPYYEPPTLEDTREFYRELNGSINLGMMVYNTYTPPGPNLYDYRLIEYLLTLPQITGIKWFTACGFQYDFVYQRFAAEMPMYDNHIHEVYGVMNGAVGFTSHIPVFWPEYGARLWDLLKHQNYIEAQKLVSRVRIPYYKLITEAWEYSSGDGIVERVACRHVGLDVGPSRKPILPCPADIADRVERLLEKIGVGE